MPPRFFVLEVELRRADEHHIHDVRAEAREADVYRLANEHRPVGQETERHIRLHVRLCDHVPQLARQELPDMRNVAGLIDHRLGDDLVDHVQGPRLHHDLVGVRLQRDGEPELAGHRLDRDLPPRLKHLPGTKEEVQALGCVLPQRLRAEQHPVQGVGAVCRTELDAAILVHHPRDGLHIQDDLLPVLQVVCRTHRQRDGAELHGDRRVEDDLRELELEAGIDEGHALDVLIGDRDGIGPLVGRCRDPILGVVLRRGVGEPHATNEDLSVDVRKHLLALDQLQPQDSFDGHVDDLVKEQRIHDRVVALRRIHAHDDRILGRDGQVAPHGIVWVHRSNRFEPRQNQVDVLHAGQPVVLRDFLRGL
mmetsp:Transcript_134688/g.430251  ORF Transcript_134688/g.430251 Transcript_134688/m.430251 type:complete len:364 (+) Transcript_134688:3249-4340(+)